MSEGAVTWGRLIKDLFSVQPAAAGAISLQILTAPFIPQRDKLGLLESNPSLGEGLDAEAEYQNALGFLAQWLGSQPAPVQSAYRDTLLRFVRPALSCVYHSNYLITQCLRWRPEEAKEPALRWLEQRLALLQTHYLIVAWLESGLEPDGVRPYLGKWLAARHSGSRPFQQFAKASFVYQAWLDAVTAGKKPLQEADRALVEEPIRAWLAANEGYEEIDFLLRSYLKAGLPYIQVARAVEDWLLGYGTRPGAVYLWKEALKQSSLALPLACQALAWCRANPGAEKHDAVWRLAQSRKFLGPPEINAAYRAAAEAVLPTLRYRKINWRLAKVVQSALTAYLRVAEVSSTAWPEVVLSVLENAFIFSEVVEAQPEVQVPELPERVGDLLISGRMQPNSEVIQRFARWVHVRWERQTKQSLAPTITRLCSTFPAQETIWRSMG